MTSKELHELLQKHPHLAPEGLPTTKQKQPARKPLERVAQGKDKSVPRFAIRFEIYSRRPCDWDNYWTKSIQDGLRQSGIIHDDSWDVLEGSVVSKKAHTDEEVGMVITLTQIQ